MQDESLALHIHWNVYSEKFNTENDKKEMDYFEWFYEELMAELEEKQPELHEQLEETIIFREKLLNCSNYVKAQTQIKVDGKTAFLRKELKGEG